MLLVNNGSIIIFRKLWIKGQNILIETFVEHIKLRRCRALYIEPPIAGQGNLKEHIVNIGSHQIDMMISNLTEDGAIGT